MLARPYSRLALTPADVQQLALEQQNSATTAQQQLQPQKQARSYPAAHSQPLSRARRIQPVATRVGLGWGGFLSPSPPQTPAQTASPAAAAAAAADPRRLSCR